MEGIKNYDKRLEHLYWLGLRSGLDGYCVDKIADIFIESKNAEYIKKFAEEIPGAPTSKMMKVYQELIEKENQKDTELEQE